MGDRSPTGAFLSEPDEARQLERSGMRAAIAEPWLLGFASPLVAGGVMHFVQWSSLLAWVVLLACGMVICGRGRAASRRPSSARWGRAMDSGQRRPR